MEYREGEKTNVVLSLNGEKKNPIAEEEASETDSNGETVPRKNRVTLGGSYVFKIVRS